MKKTLPTICLFDLNLISTPYDQLLGLVTTWLQSGRQLRLIMTPNPEQVVLAQRRSSFAQALGQADILLPDGIGLVWAARFLGVDQKTKLHKITGVDLVEGMLIRVESSKQKVLIIGGFGYAQKQLQVAGGKWQVVELSSSAIGKLEQHHSHPPNATPHIPAVFWLPGFSDVTYQTDTEQVKIEQVITILRPNMVLVAFGAPYQEEWLVAHRELLKKSGVTVAMAVGGSIDFLTGRVQRAPAWVQSVGLEWLFRLLHQPWRWRRQLRLIEFVGIVFRQKLSS